MIKKVIPLLTIFYVLGLFSCNPGARYFRMRKSRGEVFPKENVNTMERLEKE